MRKVKLHSKTHENVVHYEHPLNRLSHCLCGVEFYTEQTQLLYIETTTDTVTCEKCMLIVKSILEKAKTNGNK